jgi:hypothetical protein
LKKTLGRLAGAVLTGAVLSLAVAPVAVAQTDPSTSITEAPSTETTSSTPGEPTYTGGPVTTAPPETTQTGAPTTSAPGTTEPTKPTGTTKPTEPTSSKPSEPTTPPEDPYVDNIGAGYVGEDGIGALVIACESGEPTDVSAPDFTTELSYQDETDGRYWIYIVKVKPEFQGNSSTFTWTCNGESGKGDIEFESPIGGGSGTPGGKPEKPKQVKLKPKGGIETGFGATA